MPRGKKKSGLTKEQHLDTAKRLAMAWESVPVIVTAYPKKSKARKQAFKLQFVLIELKGELDNCLEVDCPEMSDFEKNHVYYP